MSINPFSQDSNELNSGSSIGTTFKNLRNTVILPDGTTEEVLGSGVIKGILGGGGMANVYEIWNSQLEVSRAVKLLHPNHTPEARQRFDTEIKITAKLHHPNIVEIHAVGQWNGLPYIEMERIDGVTLEQLLHDVGALPTEVCTSIAIMIGRALQFAHNQEYVIYGKNYHGVIHRDLKPSNVMITRSGVVKLMDFGIARPADASIHTTDGSILGTMQYLSPEQLEGREPDVRADMYSLGAVLYELLTGVKVFPEQNVSRLMMSKIKNYYKEINNYNVKIPFKLSRLIHCCLIHDRERRIQNATDFLSSLTTIHRVLTTETPECILARFMSESSTGKRNVLELRKKVPWGIAASIVIGSLAVFTAVKNGPVLNDMLFGKRNVLTANTLIVVPGAVTDNKQTDSLTSIKADTVNKKDRDVRIALREKFIQKAQNITSNDGKEDTILLSDKVDFAGLFVQEVRQKNYSQALDLYSKIPIAEISDKVFIYQIRALRETGRSKELKDALFSREISDGEVYLEKARYHLELADYNNALQELDQCSRATALNIESSVLRLERLYYTAVCKGKVFDQNPSPENENAALDSWYELKSELQISKDHQYYRQADFEMQRITQKMHPAKG